MLKFVPFFAVLLVLAACKKKESPVTPSACFETNKRLYKPDEPVLFENCSTNFERVEWNFGNGVTSTQTNPVFSWATKGPHPVRLTVFNKSLSSEVIKNITVADSTFAGLRASLSGWKSTYRDTVFTFIIFGIQGQQRVKLYQSTRSGASVSEPFETDLRGMNPEEEFRFRFVMRSAGGKADSLLTETFSINDAAAQIPALRSELAFVTVEHSFQIFYK